MRFARIATAFVLLVALQSRADVLTANDGRRFEGTLRAISLDAKAVFEGADGKQTVLSLEDVAAVDLRPVVKGAGGGVELRLPSGGSLLGELKGGTKDEIQFLCDLGELRVPVGAVRAVRFPAHAPADAEARRSFDEAFDRSLADIARTDDLLFARRGDDLVQLNGYLTGVSKDAFDFRYQQTERKISFPKVYALVLSARAAGAGPAPNSLGKVTGVGGGTGVFEVRELRDGKWRLLGPSGLDLTIPADRISRVEFTSGKVVHLAGLARRKEDVRAVAAFAPVTAVDADRNFPAVFEDRTPFGHRLRLGGKDVRGLCVRPRTEIRYDVSHGEFRRFTAIVGIDDSVSHVGAGVAFEVLADGKSVFKSASVGPVAAGAKATEVNLDLAGVKVLVLRVDWAAASPVEPGVGDLAVWGDAKFLRN